MFEVRTGPFLPWRVSAPAPPDDVTPDQVRRFVAEHPDARAVELSAAFLRHRPGSGLVEWERLDRELEDAGIPVYFAPGGATTWEIKVCTSPRVATSPRRVPAKNVHADAEADTGPVTPAFPVIRAEPQVLQHETPADESAEPMYIEVRIRQLADQGHSTRKIAAALETEGYRVSHMKVARELRRAAGRTQLPLL